MKIVMSLKKHIRWVNITAQRSMTPPEIIKSHLNIIQVQIRRKGAQSVIIQIILQKPVSSVLVIDVKVKVILSRTALVIVIRKMLHLIKKHD